jgi:tellurite resistance protein
LSRPVERAVGAAVGTVLKDATAQREFQTMADKLDLQTALIHAMIMMSAVDREMHNAELAKIGELVRHLPIFEGYDPRGLPKTAAACADGMADKDGPERMMRAIAAALPKSLRETGYALACDVLAADGRTRMEEVDLLRKLRQRLSVGELAAAALHRAARARYARV